MCDEWKIPDLYSFILIPLLTTKSFKNQLLSIMEYLALIFIFCLILQKEKIAHGQNVR